MMNRRLVTGVCAALTAVGTILVAVAPAHATTVGCRATYTVASQWPGGFSAAVAVTNLGSPLSSWTIGFDFNAGQRVTQGWSATWSQAGSHVAASNAAWNGGLDTGATVTVGFIGSWTGSNPPVATVTLNGVVCDGTVSGASPSNSSGFTTGAPSYSPPSFPPPSSYYVSDPGVTLTSPNSTSVYPEPGTIQISAIAGPPDQITRVEFYTAAATSGPYTLVASLPTAANWRYSYALTVTSATVRVVQARAYTTTGYSLIAVVVIQVA